MAKSYQELRNKMSAKNRARAHAKTEKMMAVITLNELRKELGLTQVEVAKLLDMHQAAISRIEGQSDMYLSTLERFIRALGGELVLVAKFKDREVRLRQTRESLGK